MTVFFVDMKREHSLIRAELDAAYDEVISSCGFILGPTVGRFEQEFAAFCGTERSVGVGCGLDALTLALKAMGVGPGDEVVTVANTFIATANAISQVGATPVLVDCDEATMNIDVDQIAAAITDKTAALLPVHLYGRLANMDAILKIAEEHGVPVLEDAAQAHGAERDGKRAGSFGVAGCFSFYPAKNLGALGDGGAVATNDGALADRIELIRSYGQKVKNRHDVPGVNSRLDGLQAAFLSVKLKHLAEGNAARRRAAREYDRLLAEVPGVGLLPREEQDSAHVYHLYVVRVDDRDRVRAALGDAGVQSGIHYPTPIHRQPAYAELGYGPGAFPVAEKLGGEILTLPMFPSITDDEIARVASALAAAVG